MTCLLSDEMDLLYAPAELVSGRAAVVVEIQRRPPTDPVEDNELGASPDWRPDTDARIQGKDICGDLTNERGPTGCCDRSLTVRGCI
jgi:hypothetical protein